MPIVLNKLIKGYQKFKLQYTGSADSRMADLAKHGQKPEVMVVACSDSRVDPAIILQCDPGDLFVVRNVASIVPPYEKDASYHGTSAALEFGICFLQVKHLILLGHSCCGGIDALLTDLNNQPSDFILQWVSIVSERAKKAPNLSSAVQASLDCSYQNCLSFPWIQAKVAQQNLQIHRWFFDIKTGDIHAFCEKSNTYQRLSEI